MEMNTTTIVLLSICIALFALAVYALFYIQKLTHQIALLKATPQATADGGKLKLGAYERLALLCERLKLNNLITRFHNGSYSARDMQLTMVNGIKEEYDYNLSQQLYVKPEIWEAVTKMKEQNIYIINQIAASLPANASGMDLNKHIVELLSTNENVTMNNVVLNAIQYETSKML